MREALANFLNQNPWVLGTIFTLWGSWELGNALFRYNQRNAAIERAIRKWPWLILLSWKAWPSRAVAITASGLILVAGLMMLIYPLGILHPYLWLVIAAIATVTFFTALITHKVKSWWRK